MRSVSLSPVNSGSKRADTIMGVFRNWFTKANQNDAGEKEYYYDTVYEIRVALWRERSLERFIEAEIKALEYNLNSDNCCSINNMDIMYGVFDTIKTLTQRLHIDDYRSRLDTISKKYNELTKGK
jgi:hypothetical protein